MPIPGSSSDALREVESKEYVVCSRPAFIPQRTYGVYRYGRIHVAEYELYVVIEMAMEQDQKQRLQEQFGLGGRLGRGSATFQRG